MSFWCIVFSFLKVRSYKISSFKREHFRCFGGMSSQIANTVLHYMDVEIIATCRSKYLVIDNTDKCWKTWYLWPSLHFVIIWSCLERTFLLQKWVLFVQKWSYRMNVMVLYIRCASICLWPFTSEQNQMSLVKASAAYSLLPNKKLIMWWD